MQIKEVFFNLHFVVSSGGSVIASLPLTLLGYPIFPSFLGLTKNSFLYDQRYERAVKKMESMQRHSLLELLDELVLDRLLFLRVLHQLEEPVGLRLRLLRLLLRVCEVLLQPGLVRPAALKGGTKETFTNRRNKYIDNCYERHVAGLMCNARYSTKLDSCEKKNCVR